ncbi:hypothetical protein V3C99_000503, partial [Haemonchus contortus]
NKDVEILLTCSGSFLFVVDSTILYVRLLTVWYAPMAKWVTA